MGVVFDEDLIALNRRLSGLDASALPSSIDANLEAHLNAAAEVVRARWPSHDRRNREWIEALEPLIEAHGTALRDDLVAVYEMPWPEEPLRVDVACFAGPVGAYTVEDPPHITISRCDSGYRGAAALEMIFHEASHLLVEEIEKDIEQEAARLGVAVPRNLWHAVIFYTAGELVRRRLGEHYVPYAFENGLWGGPMGEVAPLRQEWKPYLEGHRDQEAALRSLVRSVTEAGAADGGRDDRPRQ